MSELEKLLLDKDKQINELGGSLAVVKSVNQNLTQNIEHLRTDLDDLEQYGRRTSGRIENIPYEKGESESALKEKVVDVLSKAGVKVKEDTISRFHRSSAPRSIKVKVKRTDGGEDGDENGVDSGDDSEVEYTNVVVAQTIVRFRHWEPRRQAHLGRKNARDHGYAIRHDLTKRRYGLLTNAVARIRAPFGDSE